MSNEIQTSFEQQHNDIFDLHERAIDNLKQIRTKAKEDLEEVLKNYPHLLADCALGRVSETEVNEEIGKIVRLKELYSTSNKVIESACNAVESIRNKAIKNLKASFAE